MGHDEHGPAYPEPPGDPWGHFWAYPNEPKSSRRWWHGTLVSWACAVAIILLWALWPHSAPAMDHGFNPSDPTVKWFERKMIPNITFQQSCCGKADAYPVERVRRNTDHTWSVWLADGSEVKYPDGTHREYFDKNIPIVVPDDKVNPPDDDLDNPTDVGWIFMRVSTPAQPGAIYCVIIHPEGN